PEALRTHRNVSRRVHSGQAQRIQPHRRGYHRPAKGAGVSVALQTVYLTRWRAAWFCSTARLRPKHQGRRRKPIVCPTNSKPHRQECPCYNALTATIKPVAAPYRSYVLISREQIARNFRSVREGVGPG